MALTIFLYPSTGIALSGNPVWVTMFGDEPPAGANGYKFMLKIESTNNMLVGAPFYMDVAPSAAYVARLNIQGYVDKVVKYVFSYPAGDACIQYDNTTHEVVITAGIRYIDSSGVLHEIWNETGAELTLLKGGVSQRQVAIWKAANQSFYTIYIGAGKFLTQRPQDDIVHPQQPVKLWNFNDGTREVNTLRLVCAYSDGSTVTENLPIYQEEGYLYELNVNPASHGIDLVKEDGAKLLTWTAALYNDDVLKSDIRRFAYDLRYCERPFWLMFANSLGGIDDVYLSGYAVESFEVKGDEVYKPAQFDDTIYDRTLVVPNKQARNTWKINTGPKSATQMFHLRDLLCSREVWLIYPSNFVQVYNIVPVNITNTEVVIVDRKNDLYDTDIEMAEAHSSQFNFDNRLMV
jgi:hypothetical protein